MNPALRRLGFSAEDRVVIIHADDLGMCQATLPAFADLVDFGLMSSASVMVPCPWFLAVAAYCREHPAVDVGLHLTLTSEWQTYRWRPLTTSDPASGLLDDKGYFHHRTQAVAGQANPAAVATEMRAQLDRALAAGIDVTHLDAHMGTALAPRFRADYIRLGLERRIPPFLPRLDEAGWRRRGLGAEDAAAAASHLQHLEDRGLPLFDHFTSLPLNDPQDQISGAKARLEALPPGLSVMIFHPARDSDELRAITPDWPSRVANYETFTSPEIHDHVRHKGIQLIGYRALRDLLPKPATLPAP